MRVVGGRWGLAAGNTHIKVRPLSAPQTDRVCLSDAWPGSKMRP